MTVAQGDGCFAKKHPSFLEASDRRTALLSSAAAMRLGRRDLIKGHDARDDCSIFVAHGCGVASHVAPTVVNAAELYYFTDHRFAGFDGSRHRPLGGRIRSIVGME